MFESGYSILKALQAIVLHMQNRRFAAEIEQIASQVEKGITFSNALGQHPWLFKEVDINIVRAGETSGDLVGAIGFIVVNDTRNEEIREKVFSALAYPVTVLCMALAVLMLIMFVVVPTFAQNPSLNKMIDNGTLPLLSYFIFSASEILIRWWYLVVILIVAGVYVVRKGVLSHIGMIDRLKLSAPLFGHVVVLGALSQFVNTLNILLRNGVPIVESLTLAKGSLNNAYLEHAVNMMILSVEQGKSMAEPLKLCHYIPPIAADMIGVGEESGRLSEILDQLSKRFRVQLTRLTNRIGVFLEPIMLLLIGCFVLMVILALFLPYFQALSNT